MKCPTCPTVDLVMSERGGVEIDYCPTCRGVWLDRGELDKIIEKAIATEKSSTPPPQQAQQPQQPFQTHQPQQPFQTHQPSLSDLKHTVDYYKHKHHKHHKKHWLHDLFD
jgi:Zn-finger nucleic acid-binding protein